MAKLFAKAQPAAKAPRLIITFFTNYDTMNLQSRFNSAGIPGRLIPVPRSLSSSCGMAWEGDPADEDRVRRQIAADALVIDSITII